MKRCFGVALTQRIPELEAPSKPRDAAESTVEQAPVTGAASESAQEPISKPLWRRLFGEG
jgi:hypothetical protein